MTRWLIGLSLWISVPALAQDVLPTVQDELYFTVDENSKSFNFADTEWAPFQIIEPLADAAVQMLNLLRWTRHEEAWPHPAEAYNRTRHFGSWITDEDCFDTRAIVLERDSSTAVKYSTTNPCKVSQGTWLDPYSNKVFKKASEVQVDHLVALQNAYISGGSEWEPKVRCLYANVTFNSFHLKTVSSAENQRKSNRTPADYMPSDEAYACTYLRNWLEVKLIWQMVLSPREAKAIELLAQEHSCTKRQLQISKKKVQDQRRLIEKNQDLCSDL